MKEVKAIDIYNRIKDINPTGTTVSSMGRVVPAMYQQIADNKIAAIMPYIPEGSVAYKILTGSQRTFTTKQLWAIAFELLKNEKFIKTLNK
jgi:hypothetical protein